MFVWWGRRLFRMAMLYGERNMSSYFVRAVDISFDLKGSSRLSLVMGHPLKTPNIGPIMYLYKAVWVWAFSWALFWHGSLADWSLIAGCHPSWRVEHNEKIVCLSPCVVILDGLSVNILVTLTLCSHFTLFKTHVSSVPSLFSLNSFFRFLTPGASADWYPN